MGLVKKVWIYLLIYFAGFSVLPILLMNIWGNEMFVHLYGLIPLCFTTSFVYGKRHSFNLLIPCFACISFLMASFIFYGFRTREYALIYTLVAVSGNIAGNVINRLPDVWQNITYRHLKIKK